MIVYLLGFMGSGKSSIGKKLSMKLGWDFADLDQVIEDGEGRSISEIFDKHGETAFRKMESEYLRRITSGRNTIIACGGGTPCFFENMAFMNENGLTVYIKMDVISLKNRLVNSKKERPLIRDIQDDQLIKYLSDKLAERDRFYLQSKIIFGGLNVDINRLMNIIQA